MRGLGSANGYVHLKATEELLHAGSAAIPLLLDEVATKTPTTRAIYAALLLHTLGHSAGAVHLMRYLDKPSLRQSHCAPLLRHAILKSLGITPFLHKLVGALTQLEQRPDSTRALAQYHYAAQILLFLRSSPPLAILYRALHVRAIGGENLSVVRLVLTQPEQHPLEHISLVRRDAAEILLASATSEQALQVLLRCLLHPNPAIQLTAMFGLQKLGSPHAIDALYPIAHNPNSPVCEDAKTLIRLLMPYGAQPYTLLRPVTEELVSSTSLLRSARPPYAVESEKTLPHLLRTDFPKT